MTAQVYKHDNVVTLSSINPEEAFTDNFLKRIAKLNKRIILFFDNDALRQKSAKALRAKMEEYGIDVYTFQSDWATDMTEYLTLSYHSIDDIIKVSKNIFATATFAILKHSYYHWHRESDEFDDDVLPRLTEREKKLQHGEIDGYVTNVGTEITIHIKPELNTETNIERIKKDFGLTENNKRITKVIIVEETDIVF